MDGNGDGDGYIGPREWRWCLADLAVCRCRLLCGWFDALELDLEVGGWSLEYAVRLCVYIELDT